MIGLILTIALAAAPNCPHPKRSAAAVKSFKTATPCPDWCATYVKRQGKYQLYYKCGACDVDHICPLACCGADIPSNMQWLDKKVNIKKSDDCTKCR